MAPQPNQRLINLRLEADLTRADLAKLAGVALPVLTRAEEGLRIRDRSAYRIAKALGEELRWMELFANQIQGIPA